MIFKNYLTNFYNFYCQFSIDATTQIIDCKKFNIKFTIHQLSKQKKFNYRLLILYKNKQYYTQNIIYKPELPLQSSRFCYKLGINDYNCGLPL